MGKPLRQFVWDVPTRAFHWLLVALIGFSWWSAETFHMDWHRQSGIVVCGLVLFRVLWGVFGTETSRFRGFVKGPRGVWAYLRRDKEANAEPIGHNPLGSWSVIALLLVLGTQIVSGLFAVDVDGIESGPLSDQVSFDTGRLSASLHRTSFTVLQILVVLHVLAIAFYWLAKRRNLTWTMIAGSRPLGDAPARDIVWAGWRRLTVAVLVAVGVVWWISSGARFP